MFKNYFRRILPFLAVAAVIAISVALYLFYKPHRNVQKTEAFASLSVSDLTHEFDKDAVAANAKFLSSDGNSKVLIVEGRVIRISTNQACEKVLLLKEETANTGVSATFSLETNSHLEGIKEGDLVKVKGAITAGNSYDADLELYEHAILIHADIIK